MKEESHNPSIDPELEARIVALVLGEASDFEHDELNRLIDQRPELSTLKKQIQCVHGLLQDVATGESAAADEDWKLSAEKRSAVLAVMSGEVKQQPATQVVIKSAETQRSVKGNLFWNLTKIAAVFCVVGFFGGLMMPAFNAAREAAHVVSPLASNDASTPESSNGLETSLGENSAPFSERFLMDDAETTASGDLDFQTAGPTAAVGLEYEKNSKSALSAIRDSLAVDVTPPSSYSLMDDVQYLPAAPKFKLPQEATAPSEVRAAEKQNLASAEGVNGPEPARQTVDNLVRNAQGLGRSDADQSAPAVGSGNSNSLDVTSGVHDGGDSERRGETQDNASQQIVELGLADRPVVEGKPVSASDFAEHALGSQESGQGQTFSRGKARQPDFRFSDDLMDSLAAGKEVDTGGVVADGESQGVDRFGDKGTAPAHELRKDISAEHKPEATAKRELGVWLDLGESTEAAPSQPVVAGIGGSVDKVQQLPNDDKRPSVVAGFDGINNLPTPDLDVRFRNRGFGLVPPPGAADLGTEKENSRPSPTDEPLALRKDLEKTRELGVADRYEQGFAKGSLDDKRTLGRDAFYSGQVSEPAAGTAMARLLGELQAGQAKQDGGWQYEAQAKNPQAELPALNELDNKDGDQYWERIQPKPNDAQGELPRQRDQLAIQGQRHWYGYVPPILEDNSGSMKKAPVKKSAAPAGLNEKSAEDEAFSTFSLHVSDVSFKLAQSALARGEWPEAAKVRIEEFVNAFDYGDPMPSQSEKVACRVEQSIHPFLQQRNLLRVSMRTAAAGRSSNTPLRLTLLLDNSGSMERSDRQQTVRRAFALLAQQLKPIDQVTLISFARQPRLLADKVSGAQSSQLVGLIENLPSQGGTNIEAALQLAFEKAQEQQVDNAQNRVILLTDGAVNLGDANPESLSRMITTMRGAGIAFDAAGISAEGLNDEILEALTRKGDGRYYLLDSLEAADDGFARQIAGALRPSAKNVKVQIEFNPKRVGRYKLLGFEKHRLKQEDFRNDKVDAAEMAAAEAGVAVYQFEAKPDGEGDVGSVSVRFRDLSTGQMIEDRWPIPYEADAPRCDQAVASLRIATAAALLAAKLRGEPLGDSVDLKTLSNLISGLPDRDRNTNRVGQLQLMIEQARQVSGK